MVQWEGRLEESFRKIVDRLDVAPALAELGRFSGHWLELCDTARQIGLLDFAGSPILADELPALWSLIGRVREAASRRFGDNGILAHARVGLMRTGESVPPHFDGVDGISKRRYQIALQSEEGVVLTVGGETRRPLPGEAWQINAALVHSVVNGSRADRITILFDTAAS